MAKHSSAAQLRIAPLSNPFNEAALTLKAVLVQASGSGEPVGRFSGP